MRICSGQGQDAVNGAAAAASPGELDGGPESLRPVEGSSPIAAGTDRREDRGGGSALPHDISRLIDDAVKRHFTVGHVS